MRIDSHHHFWNYDPVEYGWIGEGMDVLKRDFGPADLGKVAKATKMDGFVSVQARQTIEETEWLCGHTTCVHVMPLGHMPTWLCDVAQNWSLLCALCHM